jgi:hypothetical protein
LDGESGHTGSGPDGWGDAADLEHGAGRDLAGRGAFSVPSELVEKPRVRLVWFWGSLTLGVGAFVGMILFTVNSHDADPVRDFSIGAATALAFGAYGACCLRWGIVADESGIQLTNTFRRHRIAWSDVEAIELEEIRAEVSIGFHRLVFVTRQKGRIAADAPTGLAEPGRRMFELWQTLSAMWLSHLEEDRDSEAAKRIERARLAGGFVGDPIDALGQESHDAERVGRPSDALLARDEYVGPPARDVEEPSNGDMPASGEEVNRRPWWPFVPWSAASATAFVALTIVCNVAEARAALTSLNLLLNDGIYPATYARPRSWPRARPGQSWRFSQCSRWSHSSSG